MKEYFVNEICYNKKDECSENIFGEKKENS